ncbi:hypothetical protein BKA65DRAFT_303337 [Rhexocercosporidium sp. MPI-PUGE-AT-0058]|nr:hypothetical protein BKA65DRAFT_303337 [Rhexocercosporidium sp. MPI-PUGE-AT-0058]
MAAAQWPETPFIPKQAQPKSAELFESIIGNTSEVVTQHILNDRLPPIQPKSVIHDNGCGTLQVTSQLFTPTTTCPSPTSTLTIHATDSNAYQISASSAKAFTNHWPVQSAIMKAQDLTFPPSTFDISFTNFVIMGLDNRPLAAQHLYRTLKPGGIAVVVTWAFMPHDIPLKKAHLGTRARDQKLRIQWGGELLLKSTLSSFYEEGGFEEEKVDIKPFELWHEVKDVRAWAEGLWSFLGDTEDGWSKEDEERWEEAVEIIVREVEEGDDVYVRNEDGKGGKLKFIAWVGLATK